MATDAGALLYYWYKHKTGIAPTPALVKAMEINLALDLTTTDPPPDTKQEFGKLDLTYAFRTDGRYAYANQEYVLTPSAPNYFSYNLVVKDTSRPVKVTLVWTDAPGSGGTGAQLRNDIDLVVYGAQTIYYCQGNNTDSTTRRSKVYASVGPPYPTPDRKNNVEQCTFLASEVGSPFNIWIQGININSDAINVWTGSTPRQDFAVFVENVIGH